MRYRLMNDYSADWPFWNDEGLCADSDPNLSPELSERARWWSEQFQRGFSYETGWPDTQTAAKHESEGRALYEAIRAAHPSLDIEFHYWERAHR